MELNDLSLFLAANWFSISFVVCSSIILYFWGIAPFRRSTIVAAVGDVPGPTPLPFVGNILDLIKFKGQFHLQIDHYYKKYGRLFTMFLFEKKPSLVVSDPEMLKEIMVKEFQSFHDRPDLMELPKPFDSMMTAAKGETWHRIRTTLSPTFSAHKMKLMIPLLNKSCDLLEKKLGHDAETGETINIYKYYQGLTMEAILATFFGIDCNAQNDYDDPAFKAGRNSLDPGPVRRFITGLIAVVPFGSYLVKFFPSFFIGQFQDLVHLTEKMIEAKRSGDSNQRKDVLGLMLNHTNDQDVPENKRLTESEVIAQSMVFLFAGYETTSNVLSLACHHIATSPNVQEKLQKEIDEVWSDEDQAPSYEVVQSLPYLDMVISETLRLYPPDGCKEMHFKFGVDGYALANHTFLTDKALDDDHCQSKCFMDDRCISYNFGRGASGELQTCELNEADHKQFPDDLVPRPDTTYNMAENTCNCTANEICRMNFVNMTHYCERKPRKYEKSITFKNCKSLQNLGEEIILDGSNPVQTGICRSVLTTTVDSPVKPYRVIVEMYSYNVGNSRSMHPGIIFNVQDEDNFDFLFTRPHVSPDSCSPRNPAATQAGSMQAQVIIHIPNVCSNYVPPSNKWFKMEVQVHPGSVTIFLDDQYATNYTGMASTLIKRGGLMVYNMYSTVVKFRNYTIENL